MAGLFLLFNLIALCVAGVVHMLWKGEKERQSREESTNDRQQQAVTLDLESKFNKRHLPHGYQLKSTALSNPSGGVRRSLWEAQLLVNTSNLHQLLTRGCHWNEGNVKEGEGYFVGTGDWMDFLVEWSRADWRCALVYRLEDRNAKYPQWKAKLIVGARDVSVLAAFQISYLRAEHAVEVLAWDGLFRPVRYASRSLSFSAYDGAQSLESCWPRPASKEKDLLSR